MAHVLESLVPGQCLVFSPGDAECWVGLELYVVGRVPSVGYSPEASACDDPCIYGRTNNLHG